MSQRIDQGGWFGHGERMGDEKMAKSVYDSDMREVLGGKEGVESVFFMTDGPLPLEYRVN